MIRTYNELCQFDTFEDRFNYLKLSGYVGEDTFGWDRYLNQIFYRSKEWRQIRNYVISRDNGCDLGIEGYEISGTVYIHHINPITKDDIICKTPFLTDPQYMVSVSLLTHNAIHYGSEPPIKKTEVIRTPNDTCPWKTL